MITFDNIDLEPVPVPFSGISDRAAAGGNRLILGQHGPLVDAQTDPEIARAYLYHAELAATTLKSTKTELGRFLLWCTSNNRTLRELRVEDLTSYKNWLRDPQPADRWISPTRWPRNDPRWRPFSGPLSDPSIRQAFRVVKSLMSFATNAGYLQRNASSLVKNIKTPRDARVTRYLSKQAINYVYAALDTMPARTPAAIRAKMRDRFLFVTYISTGARLSEIVAARMGSIYTEGDVASIGEKRWWIDVIGKGSKPRRLPVSPDMLVTYRAYRTAYGLLPTAFKDDLTPLVLNTRGHERVSVTNEAASKAMKSLFSRAADLADADGDYDSSAALRNASAHWLRHSFLTLHANNGVALKTLQDTAGHASLSTTATYLHKSDKERHDELMTSMNEGKPSR